MENLKHEHSIVALIKSALDGHAVDIPADVDWEQVLRIGKEQGLIPLLYEGASNSGVVLPDTITASFDSIALSHLLIDQKQQYAVSELLNAFSMHGIDHMPVKGVVLRTLYPHTEMRPMGDADILVKREQKDAVFSLMQQLGYRADQESDHEWIFSKDGIKIELHKSLVPSYSKDYYAYFGDGWSFAQKTEMPYRFLMRPEDHFVYLLTHFAKHFRAGGVGVLHVVDFGLLLRANKLDMSFVRAEIGKIGLLRFFDNVMETVNAWFNGSPRTEMTDFITKRVFNDGVWGSNEQHAIAMAVKASKTSGIKSARVASIFKNLFPSRKSMQYRYPILQKCGFLLPIMWIVRGFDLLLFGRDRMQSKMRSLQNISAENAKAYRNELHYVGLDFNYKE